MPIRPFRARRAFDPEAVNTMALVFDAVCDHLGLQSTSDDALTRLVAEKVIELTQRGIADADLLQSMALNELGRD